MTLTKLALAAALLASTASLAFAQEADPNLYNRYPAYNGPIVSAPAVARSASVGLRGQKALQSAPAALVPGAPRNDEVYFSQPDMRAYWADRAGHVVDGGGY